MTRQRHATLAPRETSSSSMLTLVFTYAPSVLIGGVTAVAVPALLAKSLEPGLFGSYSLVAAAAQFSIFFFVSWLVTAIIRYLPEHGVGLATSPRILRCAAIGVLGSAALMLGLLFAVPMGVPLSLPLLALVAAAVIAQGLNQLLGSALRAADWSAVYTLHKTLASSGVLAGVVLLYVLRILDIQTAFAGLLAGNLLALMAGAGLLVRRRKPRPGTEPSVPAILHYGVPVAATHVFGWALAASDRFVISRMMGPEATGCYAAPYSCTEQILLFPLGIITMALGPYSTRVWFQQGADRALRDYARQMDLITVILLPTAMTVSLFSRSLVVAFSSRAYLAGASVVPWVALGMLLVGYQWVFQRPLHMLEKTHRLFGLFLAAAIGNLLMTVTLVPLFGLEGAAVSTFLAYAALCALMYAGNGPLRRRWPIRWRRQSFVVLAGALATLLVRLPLLPPSVLYCGGPIVWFTLVGLTALLIDPAGVRARLRRPLASGWRQFSGAARPAPKHLTGRQRPVGSNLPETRHAEVRP